MRKVILACIIGNTLEWYDFALYGHFAIILSKLFFPQHDQYVGIIATYTIFAAGFLMRPLGGVIFGYIGDKYGRKVSLAISIVMMAIPTAAIGLLPTYESIGIWAPITLSFVRLLQGASIGGEFSGVIAFLVEYSPMKKRGIIGSLSMMTLAGGMLLGALVSIIVSKCMTVADFESWGWRIPFIGGIFIALIGIYLRMSLRESPVYMEAKKRKNLSNKPVREIFKSHLFHFLLAIGIYFTVTVPFHTAAIFIKPYMTEYMGFSNKDAMNVNFVSLFVMMVGMPISAYLSDLYGRKIVMKYVTYAIIVFAYPSLWLIGLKTIEMAFLSQIIFSFLVGMYMGPIPAVLVELFPTRVRFTGVALSYNLCAAVFGGTVPLVGTWLTKNFRSDSLGMYIIVFCVGTLITLKYYRETYRKPLI